MSKTEGLHTAYDEYTTSGEAPNNALVLAAIQHAVGPSVGVAVAGGLNPDTLHGARLAPWILPC
jgi:3-keto-L-gulonate-6-phosphate decarboxylase